MLPGLLKPLGSWGFSTDFQVIVGLCCPKGELLAGLGGGEGSTGSSLFPVAALGKEWFYIMSVFMACSYIAISRRHKRCRDGFALEGGGMRLELCFVRTERTEVVTRCKDPAEE